MLSHKHPLSNARKYRTILGYSSKCQKKRGTDPSYGTSNFAIVATQLVDDKIQIIAAETIERARGRRRTRKAHRRT
jgi:hypothetical protein